MAKKFYVIYLILAIWFVVILFLNVRTFLNIKTMSPTLLEEENIIMVSSTTSTTPIVKDGDKKDELAVESVSEKKIGTIKLNVPFTTQAPFAEWSDERQQNACEEAAGIMAMAWVHEKSLSKQEARDEIIAISDWEMDNYGVYQDTSAEDTVNQIFKGYFGYEKVELIHVSSSQDIIGELEKANLVIIPVNGQELNNPYFTAPGPLEHMIVVIGYDYDDEEFIVNESGTRHGKNYRYDNGLLFNAIRNYPTGYREPISGIVKVMIVIKK